MPSRAATRTAKLAGLASPLRPERAPYYVRLQSVPPGLDDVFPAEGWYWVPHGHHTAVYLAATFERAAIQLDRLVRQEQEAA